MDHAEFVFAIPITVILGGCAIAIAAIWQQSKVRQLEIQERIAMIQKGIMPPAPPPPGETAASHGASQTYGVVYRDVEGSAHAYRYTTAGTVLVGIGLGLMMLLTFAAESGDAALGVGGGVVILGGTFLVIGAIERRRHARVGFGPPPSIEVRSHQGRGPDASA
jgi:hypothetical protein